jgi:ABC-type branched-subunit amino acid transport system substrate-binding protein
MTTQLRGDNAMYVHSLFKNILRKLGWFLAFGATFLAAGSLHARAVQGVSHTEILIGSHADLSGPIASTGVPVRDGMLFAVDDVNTAGGGAVERLSANFPFLNSAQPETPALRVALDRFKARFGNESGDGIAMGYMQVMLFAEGAKNAGRALTQQTLTQGLEKVKDFTTVFEEPPISYAPGNHAPPRTTIIMEVRGGKYVPVTGPVAYLVDI